MLQSLEGLALGDSFGDNFFLYQVWQNKERADKQIRELIASRKLPAPVWRYTDDTRSAFSIVEVLRQYGRIDQDALMKNLVTRYQEGPQRRGYGMGAEKLFQHCLIHGTDDWREHTTDIFPEGSYGNGAAMRVAPLGAYFAGDMEQLVLNARLSAEVTHSHPEGIAGAIAVALATALASNVENPRYYINSILKYMPESKTKEGIALASRIIGFTEVEEVAERLGSGNFISAQDTVPFAIWIAANRGHDYKNALWETARGLGDIDTTCAIVGGIIALKSPPPLQWLYCREDIPEAIRVRCASKFDPEKSWDE